MMMEFSAMPAGYWTLRVLQKALGYTRRLLYKSIWTNLRASIGVAVLRGMLAFKHSAHLLPVIRPTKLVSASYGLISCSLNSSREYDEEKIFCVYKLDIR